MLQLRGGLGVDQVVPPRRAGLFIANARRRNFATFRNGLLSMRRFPVPPALHSDDRLNQVLIRGEDLSFKRVVPKAVKHLIVSATCGTWNRNHSPLHFPITSGIGANG